MSLLTSPPSSARTTPSTCCTRGSVSSAAYNGHRCSDTPGTRPLDSATPKLMRFRIAPVLIHPSPVSGQPFGA